jgi:hypothetical protein
MLPLRLYGISDCCSPDRRAAAASVGATWQCWPSGLLAAPSVLIYRQNDRQNAVEDRKITGRGPWREPWAETGALRRLKGGPGEALEGAHRVGTGILYR